MAVMLDGSSTQTRTGRWLRALTPQMVMRFVPVLGVVGVPLAFLVSYERQMAKAQYFGIPVEFIHVQLADAVAPFLTIAVLLWPLFIALHEVERLGVARVANYVGGWIRLWFMLVAVAVAVASFGQSRHNNGIAAALLGTIIGLLVLYVLLWWIPPGVSWIGRKLTRAAGAKRWRPGRLVRHLYRGALDYPSSQKLRKFQVQAVVVGTLLISAPAGLGLWEAWSQEDFTVITPAAGQQQAVLAVYGDKTFIATVDGDRIRSITMRQTADVKDVAVSIERIGPLRPNTWQLW
jgi:hypothetical protein